MFFKNRRLLTISFVAVLSVFFAQALPESARLAFVFLAACAAVLCLLFSLFTRRLLACALALLLCAIAIHSTFTHESRTAVLRDLDETMPYIFTVKLREFTHDNGDFVTARAELIKVEGDCADLSVRVVLPKGFAVGDVVRGEGTVSLSDVSDYDKSNGILAFLFLESAEKIDTFDDLALRTARLRASLVARIRDALPAQESALFSALLFGDREWLPDELSRDMTRIGTVHILALSGTHVVLLSAALEFLLCRARLGRHLRTLLICLFLLFFILLTGFSPSVLRACFMFFFSALSARVRAERDSITALFAAVAVILLAEPYTATSQSLWLSAFATLGILLTFDRLRDREPPRSLWGRVCRFCLFSLAVTVSAGVATLPLSAIWFGRLPLLSLLANFLLMPLFQIALYLAVAITAVGAFPPLAVLSRAVCTAILFLTQTLADIPNTVLYIGEGIPLVLSVCLFAFLAIYFFFCPRRHFSFRTVLVAILCFSVTLAGTLTAQKIAARERAEVTYYADVEGQTDFFLVRTAEADTLIVITEGTSHASRKQRDLLRPVSELDALVFLCYGDSPIKQLCQTLRDHTVHTLYLPAPQTCDETYDYERVLDTAAVCGTAVKTFDGELVPGRDVRLSVIERHVGVAGNTESTVFRLLVKGERLLYVSGAAMKPAFRDELARADVLYAGVFGGPPFVRYHAEDFLQGAYILCASEAYFPFFEYGGLPFFEKHTLVIR